MPVNGREYEFESATFKETETTTFNAKYKDGGLATFEISKAEVKEFLESLKPGGVGPDQVRRAPRVPLAASAGRPGSAGRRGGRPRRDRRRAGSLDAARWPAGIRSPG